MLRFGPSLSNPLLQVALSVGEATIRDACGRPAELQIELHLGYFPLGRDSVRVVLQPGAGVPSGRFELILRNYFDPGTLYRVAHRAWLRLLSAPQTAPHEEFPQPSPSN